MRSRSHIRPVVFAGLLAVLVFLILASGTGTGVHIGATADVGPMLAEDGDVPDHSQYIDGDNLNTSNPAATCQNCHPDAVTHAADSAHFQWRGQVNNTVGETGETLGKRDSLNNFCQGIRNNEKKCAGCHTGFGMDASNPAYFEDPENVDCLACHADPETYPVKTYKNPVAANPDFNESDMLAAAQSVGEPSKENCLSCHAEAGGGDQHKIGDLGMHDASPSLERSVHMSPEGADLECQACHETEDHKIAGSSVHIYETENGGVTCTQCHDGEPHATEKLNTHTEAVACQTCHLPAFARTLEDQESPTMTKLNWDWDKVGQADSVSKQKLDDGTVLVTKPKAGEITLGTNVKPVYRWYNGNADKYYLQTDTVNPDGPTVLAEPLGEKGGEAKIYPFKEMTGTQAVDAESGKILPMNYMGAEDGLWSNHLYEDGVNESEWDRILGSEAEAYGLEYNGEVAWEETVMYLRLNHEIPPAENALTCDNCHGDDGRMNWAQLGYEDDPRALAQQTTTTTTTTQTTTQTTPETTTTTETATPENTTEGESPGLGIGVAILSLVAAALLARRRTG